MERLKIKVKVADYTVLPHLPRDSYQYGECYKREGDLLFHMTQLKGRCNAKVILQKATNFQWKLEEIKIYWQRADQRKQRLSLCHIRLAKDLGDHLVNQPCKATNSSCNNRLSSQAMIGGRR